MSDQTDIPSDASEDIRAEGSAQDQADQLFIHGLLKYVKPKAGNQRDRVSDVITRLRMEEESQSETLAEERKEHTWWLPLSILTSAAAIIVSIVLVAERFKTPEASSVTPLDVVRKAINRSDLGEHFEYRIRIKRSSNGFPGGGPSRGKLVTGPNGHYVAGLSFGMGEMKLGYDGAEWWAAMPTPMGTHVMISDQPPPSLQSDEKNSIRRAFRPERIFGLSSVFNVPEVLDLMEDDYELEFFDSPSDSQRISLQGTLREPGGELPETIKLESNQDGEILALRLYWNKGRDMFLPSTVHIERVGKTTVVPNYYRHDSHHDDDATIKRMKW